MDKRLTRILKFQRIHKVAFQKAKFLEQRFLDVDSAAFRNRMLELTSGDLDHYYFVEEAGGWKEHEFAEFRGGKKYRQSWSRVQTWWNGEVIPEEEQRL